MDHQNFRVRQNNANQETPPFFEPIFEYYYSLPPITRAWFTLSLATTSLQTLDAIPESKLIFRWDRVSSPHLELWRILTSFVWAGPGTLIDFPCLMLLYSMAVVVPSYEKDPHEACWIEDETNNYISNNDGGHPQRRRRRRRRPKQTQSDCLFALFTCVVLILASYLLVTETSFVDSIISDFFPELLRNTLLLPVFTRTLLYSLITLDSLKHPLRQVNINFFPVPGRYVPLFHVGFGLLMGYRINESIHGIIIGFMYKCLVEEDGILASAFGRKRLLSTPQILIHLVGEDNFGAQLNSDDLAEDGTAAMAGVVDTNNPYEMPLEPGANQLHRAASIGDITFLRQKLEEIDSLLTNAATAADVAAMTSPFRQPDRNGWQPLHEAAREGSIDVLKFLLEIVAVPGEGNSENRNWRRRSGKLKINVNARTHNGRGCTALWLIEHYHGIDSEIAGMVRAVGGISLATGEAIEGESDNY